MARERDIVCLINDELNSQLTTFKKKVFHNIAIQRENSTGANELISIEKGLAEKKIFPDDSFEIMGYHKYAGSTYEEKRGYGASAVTYSQTADMTLTIIARRTKDLTDDRLEGFITNIIGITLTKQQLTTLELMSSGIVIRSTNIDAGIIVREFPELKRNTFPNILCFEVKYSIITKYGAGCADLCLN